MMQYNLLVRQRGYISRQQWNEISGDYKGIRDDGTHSVMTYHPKHATMSCPVKVVDELPHRIRKWVARTAFGETRLGRLYHTYDILMARGIHRGVTKKPKGMERVKRLEKEIKRIKGLKDLGIAEGDLW